MRARQAQRPTLGDRANLLPAHVEERLRLLAALPAGWDGNGALPVSREAEKKLRKTLNQAYSRAPGLVPEPFIAPDPEGGLGLEWEFANGNELLLSVSPSGEVTYLLAMPSRTEQHGSIRSAADLQNLIRQALA